MSYINEQNQDSKYGQLARKLVKIASISGRKVVLRHTSDTSTELSHEFGTTDVAVGDVAAEVMITTLGKIPNEMYYLEDTTVNPTFSQCKADLQDSSFARALLASTESYEVNISNNQSESSSHSSVLVALLVALLIILLLCCVTACFVARSKRKTTFFGKSDMECEPGCAGMSQPLLNKLSSTTNKTSVSSLRN